MKKYSVLSVTAKWSLFKNKQEQDLRQDVENILNEKAKEGYEVVSVSFVFGYYQKPEAFITICK